MTTLDTSPTFNLKVVVHETGVKPDTLRAWERRYGLPNPMRSEGRHRLYSPYDIQVILWLVARQTEGLSISRAAELWHSLVDAGKDPLQLYVDTGSPTTPEIPPTSVGSKIDDIRAAWIQACMQFDERQAEQILTHAFALYSPVMVCLEVLQKGLAQIGESWYRNTATVQQEHFASALAMRRINALVAAAPAPTRTERLVVACPAHEDHVFAPLLLTLILRYQGWDVVYLGANVPTTRLESLLESVEPDLLILTAQQLYTSANLLQLAEYVADKGHMLAFGGRIFNYIPQLRERIPGFFLGERLEGAARSVAQLLAQRPSPPPTPPLPASYHRALAAYRGRQVTLESRVWDRLKAPDMSYEHIANANLHLSREIVAALQLGDMTLLGTEISWTEKLLLNYNMPPETLRHYLTAYYEAAREVLAEDGRPIVGWLEGICSGDES